MLWLAVMAALAGASPGRTDCGGILKAQHGTIQTPSFPKPFQVPIKCRWLLDATDHEFDAQIVVYLTQMFVSSGLTFTEYDYYDPSDPSLQRNPVVVLSLSEENFIRTRWVFTRSKFFLIDLELERLEGNHLRVLDDLLDVYGFNITYEMVASPEPSESPVRNNSCNVVDCSLAGNCFANSEYTDFWCSCFPHFSGPNCNLGPVCKPDSNPCQNGGICRHSGKYPTCGCEPGYTGARCEVLLIESGCSGEGECSDQCRFDGRDENICNCDDTTAPVEPDRWRYVIRVRIANISALDIQHPGRTLNNFIEKQIQRFFRPISLNRFEDLLILNISDNGEMSFQFFGSRQDTGKVRDAVTKMGERVRLGEITIYSSPVSLYNEQGLHLEGIVTDNNSVRENDEVILSCIAQGSDQITFNWYKDGYSIDISKASGGIWMKLLPKNSKEEYTAILGIETASTVDEGQYTCHVSDWAVQECKSIYLAVQGPPIVQVSPMSVSLKKGDDITLKCVSPNQRVWYSWTRDHRLFPLNPGQEVWEDLKPWGSILRVSNIQKSTTYTCHAHTSAASREHSVRIELLTVGSCSEEEMSGVLWKETAPGAMAMADCPSKYIGYAKRYCLTIKTGEAVWMEPDFSNCVSEGLETIINDFRLVSRGFMKASLWSVLSDLYSWSNSKPMGIRGEGEAVLDLLGQVLEFVNRTFTPDEVLNVTKVFYANIDLLLSQPNSIIHDEKVGELQTLSDNWSLLWNDHMNYTFAHLAYDELVIDTIKLMNDGEYRYYIPRSLSYPRWYTAKIAIDLMGQPGNLVSKVAIVNYHNISQFLPMTSSQILSDGSELTYELHSNIISISTGGGINMRLEMTIPVKEVRSGWNLTCGRTDLLGLEWDFFSCHHVFRSGNSTRCQCQKPGVYAALMTKHSSTDHLFGKTGVVSSSLVALGCSCCLVQSLLSLLLLITRWWRHRTCTLFFKIQSCFAVSTVMCIFVYASKMTPHQNAFQLITIILELFFFLGISSHLGKLLIIYTEVVFIPNFKSVKHTIFGITSGATLLTCLISLLAENLSGQQSGTWWLPPSSPAFYTAGVSASLIVCLYLLLVTSLIRRLIYLRRLKDPKSNYIITRRLGLLKRTTVLFVALMAVSISSIAFVNSPNKPNIYIFSILSALLGFLMFFCYIVHSESSFNLKLMKQLKIKVKDQEYSSDSDYNLFNFFTKQEPEVESEGAPPVFKGETSIPLKEISDNILHKPRMVTFTDNLPFYDKKVNNVDLEVYPNSPKKYHQAIGGKEISSGLVTSLDIVPETESLQKNGQVEKRGPEEEGEIEGEREGGSSTDVLNRISHDLDYLLNRTPSPPHQPSPEESPVLARPKPQQPRPPEHSSYPSSPSYIGKTTL